MNDENMMALSVPKVSDELRQLAQNAAPTDSVRLAEITEGAINYLREVSDAVAKKAEEYATKVYDGESGIKEMEKDKKTLGNIQKKLKETKQLFKKAYGNIAAAYGTEADGIIELIDGPLATLTENVNHIEEQIRSENRLAIRAFYDSAAVEVGDFADGLYDLLYEDSWCYKTTFKTKKNWQLPLLSGIKTYIDGMNVLKNMGLPEYLHEGVCQFQATLDLTGAQQLMLSRKAAHDAEVERQKQQEKEAEIRVKAQMELERAAVEAEKVRMVGTPIVKEEPDLDFADIADPVISVTGESFEIPVEEPMPYLDEIDMAEVPDMKLKRLEQEEFVESDDSLDVIDFGDGPVPELSENEETSLHIDDLNFYEEPVLSGNPVPEMVLIKIRREDLAKLAAAGINYQLL